MKNTQEPLINFNPKLPFLSKNEREVLKLLIEAAELVVPLYRIQENKKFPGANFYPHNLSREDIQKMAVKDSQILSSYTIVEYRKGKLVSVPYHEKYSQYLIPIAEKLERAANLTDNKNFASLLQIQAKALLEGSYEKAMIARLKMNLYIIDISIGPNDYFDDQLFFKKTSYQAWVGVLDVEATKKFSNYKEIILSVRRTALIPSERIDNNENVKVRVEDVVIFSGLMARTRFVGVNIPFDINLVEKFGSEIVLFKQANELRTQEQILPTFKKIFSEGFKEGFNEEDLRRGNINYVALHELAHSYLRYRNAPKNLQDLFPCIDELAATTLGIRVGGSLLLKDLVTTKQLESMIIAYLCRSMYLVKNRVNEKAMSYYATAGAIFLNFMLESGAIKQFKGLTITNFTKVFISIHDLSIILEQLLSQGKRKDAEIFIKKYGHYPQFS